MSWQLTECLKPIASGLNTVLDYDLFVKIFMFKKSLQNSLFYGKIPGREQCFELQPRHWKEHFDEIIIAEVTVFINCEL